MPEQFFRQTQGSVTVGELAELADDPAVRATELEDAGVVAGYFSYWSESLERPPFDPPLDLVCQSLLLGSESEAGAYVASLGPGPEVFAATALAWLPDTREVTELPGSGEIRVFELSAEGEGEDVHLFAVVRAESRVVQSLYLGGRDGRATAEGAIELSDAVSSRVSSLEPPGN